MVITWVPDRLVLLYAAVALTYANTIGSGKQLELCCTMCRNMFEQTPISPTSCTYDTAGEYAQCSGGSSSGLSTVRLSCYALNASLVSQCSVTKAPNLDCERTFQRGVVRVNYSWPSPAFVNGSGCVISLSSPVLLSADSQTSHAPVLSTSCVDQRCSAMFLYPESEDMRHCPSDKLLATAAFGQTAIRAAFTYELVRSGTYGAKTANGTGAAPLGWAYQDQWLIVQVPPPLVQLIKQSCLTKSQELYCHLDAIQRNVSVTTILYSPIRIRTNFSADALHQLTASCQFDKLRDLHYHELRVRFYLAGYESDVYSIPGPTVVERAAFTDDSASQLSMTFFVVASCILAVPALCGLVLCFAWFRKHCCTSPWSLYKNCIAKRRLRRTADWVVLVQTKWSRSPCSAAGGVSNSEFQPSTPTSIVTERARTERSLCWPDEDEGCLAPSLKRPLMRTVRDLTPQMDPNQCSHADHEPISAMSSAMESWYEYFDAHNSMDTNDESVHDDGQEYIGNVSSINTAEPYDLHGPVCDSASATVHSGVDQGSELVRIDFRRSSSSDDEISFTTAFDVDPRSAHFVEACARRKTLDIV